MGDICLRTHITAKKQHKCGECMGLIDVGESYVRFSGAFEGHGFTHKMCSVCDSLLSKYIHESNCMEDEYPEFGNLRFHLFESDIIHLQEEFSRNQQARLAPARSA